MKKLIAQIQNEWQKAKKSASMRCIKHGDVRMAQLLTRCDMFKGTETLRELVDLMFTPQGIEFVTRYDFPSLASFRKFKVYEPEQYGVYIDAGEITLADAKRVFLVGKTSARLEYGEIELNRLCLMHGARADIIARGYAVVKIEKDHSSHVNITTEGEAKILQ